MVEPETPAKVDEKAKQMESDLFVEDQFVYYKEVKIPNKKNPDVITTYKFGLKEITGFEEDGISKHAMKLIARTGKMELNQEEANIQFLKAVIVEAPFDITHDNIRRLSKKVRDILLDFAREINEVPEDTEKK